MQVFLFNTSTQNKNNENLTIPKFAIILRMKTPKRILKKDECRIKVKK